jgi:hypothetical protein
MIYSQRHLHRTDIECFTRKLSPKEQASPPAFSALAGGEPCGKFRRMENTASLKDEPEAVDGRDVKSAMRHCYRTKSEVLPAARRASQRLKQ